MLVAGVVDVPTPQLTLATCTVIAVFEPGVVTTMVAAVPLDPPDFPGVTMRFPVLCAAALIVVTPSRHLAEKGPTVVPPTRTVTTVASASPSPTRREIPLATTAPDRVDADPPPVRIAPLLLTVGAGPKRSPPVTSIPFAEEADVAACAWGGPAVMPKACVRPPATIAPTARLLKPRLVTTVRRLSRRDVDMAFLLFVGVPVSG
ncbi:hypothetical protein AB0878_45035 [Amycolatopsis sp. NPDC047767]|uniref:hypothetical protein n=1 Tax=Amycolatopsis sp. NPDC047767 TaxID=3156765 RepID=UPI003457251B